MYFEVQNQAEHMKTRKTRKGRTNEIKTKYFMLQNRNNKSCLNIIFFVDTEYYNDMLCILDDYHLLYQSQCLSVLYVSIFLCLK